MAILGIDYGRVYLGLAVAKENIPFPLTVIKSKSDNHKISEIVKICKREKISRIIVGKGSGRLENHIRGFVNKLKKKVDQEILFVDEALTTNQAVNQMIVEGVSQKRRKELEHAYAAALLLTLYQNTGKTRDG